MSRDDNKIKGDGMIWNVPNSKKSNSKIKNENLLEFDEWFVYLIDGEKCYFKSHQSDEDCSSMGVEVRFLGIGRPNELVHKAPFPTKYLTPSLKKYYTTNDSGSHVTCCYCEVSLYKGVNYTREHVLPISRGGKGGSNIRPCCFDCNNEKGNLMLHSYIQFLNLQLSEKQGADLDRLQTKIKNANKIAQEINND